MSWTWVESKQLIGNVFDVHAYGILNPANAGPDYTKSWIWWSCLVLVSFFHLAWFAVEWVKYLHSHERERYFSSPGEEKLWYTYGRKRAMLMLCFPYIFQIAWRSVYPAEYIHRTAFFETSANSVMVERLLAAVGETAFAAQLATAICWVSSDLERLGETMQTFWCWPVSQQRSLLNVRYCARFLVVMSVVGQFCATTGTATKDRWWFVVEGVIWSAFFCVTAFCGWVLAPECYLRAGKSTSRCCPHPDVFFTRTLYLASIPSFIYMVFGYCPMCYEAMLVDRGAQLQHVDFAQGFHEAMTQRTISRSWTVWRHECIWMTLYFVFGGMAAVANVVVPPGARPKARRD
jgi:hypothetical protein